MPCLRIWIILKSLKNQIAQICKGRKEIKRIFSLTHNLLFDMLASLLQNLSLLRTERSVNCATNRHNEGMYRILFMVNFTITYTPSIFDQPLNPAPDKSPIHRDRRDSDKPRAGPDSSGFSPIHRGRQERNKRDIPLVRGTLATF